MKLLTTAALTAGLLASSALVANQAQAVVIGGTSCSVGEVTISGASADQCSGYYSGNDKPSTALSLLNDDALFGDLNWSLAATDGDFSVGNGTSGNWSLGSTYSGPATIAVKAGNSFSLYFFEDLADFDAGTFDTSGVAKVGGGKNGGNTPGLSHLSLYMAEGGNDEPPTDIPEPFGLLGLAVAGGFGATLKRRQR
jgi:hypothetical protein